MLPVLEALSVWRLSEATEFEGQERLPVTDNVGRAFIKKRCDLKKNCIKTAGTPVAVTVRGRDKEGKVTQL